MLHKWVPRCLPNSGLVINLTMSQSSLFAENCLLKFKLKLQLKMILYSKFSVNSGVLDEEQAASLVVALSFLRSNFPCLSQDIFATFCAEQHDVFRQYCFKEIELMKELTDDILTTLEPTFESSESNFCYFIKYRRFISPSSVSKLNEIIKSFIISHVKNLNTKALGAALEILLTRVEAKIEDSSEFNDHEWKC